MKNNQPTIIVIIGISGDLSRRKLLPALAQISAAGELPYECRIVGITRQYDLLLSDVLTHVEKAKDIEGMIEFWNMELDKKDAYEKLGKHLKEIERGFTSPAQRLFYLSVPPQISRPIIELLGESGLASAPNTKLLLEKPFGVDFESAQELANHVDHYFLSDQVYRIDHYLAKETAQNLVVFRQDNSLFKRTWNKDFIESVNIIASEKIGIEGRSIFYEQTGALRDLVQSHLLQLTALILMELPSGRNFAEIPARRLAALNSLRLKGRVEENVIRGQYRGYQSEVKNHGSHVETFVSLTLESDDERFINVPIVLTTGKALAFKETKIIISYKRNENHESNQLILHLQPDEGVELCLFAKRPGYEHQVERHPLKFSFGEYYSRLPEAYEQVLFDAINSNHTLFASSEEVLASWRILDSIQKTWAMNNNDLLIYEPGSKIEQIIDKKN
ncbi:MAG: glucose-6-phosphate dehydrogenase [Patescibacteria group bacterium]|nr:glucose-6-phosphate dehydrogenase [Patescibacteria group bacterium]MDD4444082.1 glucose-6-phosphate dehydrogenase [Patescibacteria group bacterium]